MPREARVTSESGRYHIMLRGINKQNIFENDEDKNKYISILSEYKEKCGFEIYGFCLMSNHIHLLIKTGADPLENIFKKIGSKYVYWYNLKYDRCGHLFQDRFKSEPVDSNDYFLTVLRYIHRNPLKGGITNNLDYKFSSYSRYASENTDGFIDTSVAERLSGGKAQLLTYFNEPIEDSELFVKFEKPLRLNDEAAQKLLLKISHTKTITEFQLLPTEIQKSNIIKSHKKGISIRQLNRLTGISKGIIERILKEYKL